MCDIRRSLARTLAALPILVCLATASDARAEISTAECERLKAENSALVAQGVPKLMEKGPDWAKSNLDAAKLASVKRLIDVSEQIMFRCEQLRPINTKVEQVETEGAESDDSTQQPAPASTTAVPKPKTQSAAPPPAPPKAAPKPRSAAASARTGGEPPQPTAADLAPVEPRRTAKPKSNDAYTPSTGSSTLNEQAKP